MVTARRIGGHASWLLVVRYDVRCMFLLLCPFYCERVKDDQKRKASSIRIAKPLVYFSDIIINRFLCS